MSKTVPPSSVPIALQTTALFKRKIVVPEVLPVFTLERDTLPIPTQAQPALENLVTRQIRQVLANNRTPAEQMGAFIILSIRGTIQIYRKNPDGSIGHLIVETPIPTETKD